MKICWDNLEDIRLTRQGNFKNSNNTLFIYGGNCKECGCEYLMDKRKPTDFCSLSCASTGRVMVDETKDKISKSLKGRKFSKGHREKIGSSLSKLYEDVLNCPMYGKRHSEESKNKMSEALTGRKLSKEHRLKLSEMKKELFKDPIKNPMYGKQHAQETKDKLSKIQAGKKHSEEAKIKMSLSRKGVKNKNCAGIMETGWASYNTYAKRLSVFEEVRRSKNNNNFLEVTCAYCGNWFIPKWYDVRSRIAVFNGKISGEYRLYCSEGCKSACPIYGQRVYPKGYKKATSREVQPQLRQLVLERDNWVCQKCGKISNEAELYCHHILPLNESPIESADIDNCITLCKKCHDKVHKIAGCGFGELKCSENRKN